MNNKEFEEKLRSLLNGASCENASNTPDFILANYLLQCLNTFNGCVKARDRWYGIAPAPAAQITCSGCATDHVLVPRTTER